MIRIGIRELREGLSSVVHRVRQGEVVEITDHGHPVVRMVPLSYRNRLDELVAQGKATAAEGTSDELLDYEPPPLPPGVPTASQVLAELRAEER